MDDIVSMTVLNGFQQLVDVATDSLKCKAIWILFKDLEEVLLKIFKYEV